MVTIRPESAFIKFVEDQGITRSVMLFDLDVDSVSELPTGTLNGDVIAHGSIAHVITTGDFYSYGGDGAWYNQDGSDAPQPNTLSTTYAAPQQNLSQNISPSLDRAQFTDIEPAKEVTEDESVRGTESEQSAEIS